MVDIDPLTGAPVVSIGDIHKVTSIPDAPPASATNTVKTESTDKGNEPNQETSETVELNTVEVLEKKVSDLQEILMKANVDAHNAHQNLMAAQRELMHARAN